MVGFLRFRGIELELDHSSGLGWSKLLKPLATRDQLNHYILGNATKLALSGIWQLSVTPLASKFHLYRWHRLGTERPERHPQRHPPGSTAPPELFRRHRTERLFDLDFASTGGTGGLRPGLQRQSGHCKQEGKASNSPRLLRAQSRRQMEKATHFPPVRRSQTLLCRWL